MSKAKPDLAAEHLLQNCGCRCQILGYFGAKFLGIECTLEAETSMSNLTQYRLFIDDDKKYAFCTSIFRHQIVAVYPVLYCILLFVWHLQNKSRNMQYEEIIRDVQKYIKISPGSRLLIIAGYCRTQMANFFIISALNCQND